LVDCYNQIITVIAVKFLINGLCLMSYYYRRRAAKVGRKVLSELKRLEHEMIAPGLMPDD
jgi:hypothetical protein